MVFSKFLEQALDKDFWSTNNVICFKGDNYPALFFLRLFDFLDAKKVLPACRKNLIVNKLDKASFKGSLYQSFLGKKSFYWSADCCSKGKNDFLKILQNYHGPNFISFFLNDEKRIAKNVLLGKNCRVINLENNLNENLFLDLLKFFDLNFGEKKLNFISDIFKRASALSLDQVCLLIQYLELINARMIEDFRDYLFSIIVNVQPSLFVLSQCFFENKPIPFFKIWGNLYNDYSEMFWLSFWSNQVWRAYYVVSLLQHKDFAKARSLSFRLPFNFIKRDWKNFSLKQLKNEYNFLYENDFAFKRGSAFCFLDLFYAKHFSKNF